MKKYNNQLLSIVILLSVSSIGSASSQLVRNTAQPFMANRQFTSTAAMMASQALGGSVANGFVSSGSNSGVQQPTNLTQFTNGSAGQYSSANGGSTYVGMPTVSYATVPQNVVPQQQFGVQGGNSQRIQDIVDRTIAAGNGQSTQDVDSGSISSSNGANVARQPVTSSSLSQAMLPPSMRSLVKPTSGLMTATTRRGFSSAADRTNQALQSEDAWGYAADSQQAIAQHQAMVQKFGEFTSSYIADNIDIFSDDIVSPSEKTDFKQLRTARLQLSKVHRNSPEGKQLREIMIQGYYLTLDIQSKVVQALADQAHIDTNNLYLKDFITPSEFVDRFAYDYTARTSVADLFKDNFFIGGACFINHVQQYPSSKDIEGRVLKYLYKAAEQTM